MKHAPIYIFDALSLTVLLWLVGSMGPTKMLTGLLSIGWALAILALMLLPFIGLAFAAARIMKRFDESNSKS